VTVRLLGPADVRALASSLDLRPSKQRGQNFVVDANTVRRIVRVSGVGPADRVLEVGPGLGSLTLPLLEAAGSVLAVEVDPRLADALGRTVAERAPDRAGGLSVLTLDALAMTRADVAGDDPTALVANLPYNVAVPVLLHLLEQLDSLDSALVMVQAEVADRLSAAPGTRTYGVPSVKARWYADVRRAGAVSRTVFWPVPRVDSGLVALTRRPAPPTTASRAEVFVVVDAAFAQRRKTLRAALTGWAGSARGAELALRAAGVDPAARGEQLDVSAFARIAERRPDRG
jgi:16S rRNA (adenine1518-N6/adenine1519-N6)-dimethyltransferase